MTVGLVAADAVTAPCTPDGEAGSPCAGRAVAASLAPGSAPTRPGTGPGAIPTT